MPAGGVGEELTAARLESLSLARVRAGLRGDRAPRHDAGLAALGDVPARWHAALAAMSARRETLLVG
ncbi:hypothetical protein [Krasilnikoviella flava]|uniref:Uncharacterized protein n=1 Tax=Krasilnikoviella flava TaxID=526729 RepID=A0A1T5ILC0_9MICO|nr:hypothetical protein [Krasilnikoviella flava]SKC39947.1 hypothetical protein SAMN04324258_0660 [Krasilnikoviella flava]